MSVFFENRGRESDQESDAATGVSRRSLSRWRARGNSSPRHRQDDDRPLWGFSYERVEAVVHLLLAFGVVGGAAAILSAGLFNPGAPVEKIEAQAALTTPLAAPPAPAAAPAAKKLVETGPVAPAEKVEQAPAAPAPDPLLNVQPIAQAAAAPLEPAIAPEPLAPPTMDLREKLAPREEMRQQDARDAIAVPPPASAALPQETAYQPPASEKASVGPEKLAAENKAAEGGRIARCYLKLSGRVQTSGACRVRHTAEAVVFQLPGKQLEITHAHGRTWMATLGGQSLGKVFKSGACWGARAFYACENG